MDLLFFDARNDGQTVNVIMCDHEHTHRIGGETIRVTCMEFVYDSGEYVRDSTWTPEEFQRFHLAASTALSRIVFPVPTR